MRPEVLKKNFLSSPPPYLRLWMTPPPPIWRSRFATAYLRVCQPVHPPPDLLTCLPTWGLGCLPFAQTNQVEILCIIVKSIKFDLVGDQQATQYIKISLTHQKEKKNNKLLHHLTNHGPYFLKLPKQNGPNHLIFQLLFSVFLCKW